MSTPRILGLILAGGKGERLFPLTQERSKPAVPFGSKYRIADFVLSNFINSQIYSLYILVQYKSQSLIDHIRRGWRIGGLVEGHFIITVPPQMRWGETWYRGTADAVFQNLNLIRDVDPDLVAIFGADHIYRMDLQQMVASHLNRRADVSVAALPVPIESASGFGIIEADVEGRIIGWEEKPREPKPMPGDPTRAFSSMGNYIFTTDVLVEALVEDARRSTDHDFGRTIIPELYPYARAFAYDFMQNAIPGIHPGEELGYWRDVGTIEAYWRANMDLLGPAPALDLDNPRWPVLGSPFGGPSARILDGVIEDVLLGEGTLVRGATIRRSIVGRGVTIERGATIENSIIMDNTTVGPHARIRRTIVDRFNTVPAGAVIGEEAEPPEDAIVDPSGITIVARGTTRVRRTTPTSALP
ncbi:MAG TPA: glucose-1-phosphate adenylyltransferase [bacterium]|nr:glucose-1-phosphate adenylyltransferase [bacterium]